MPNGNVLAIAWELKSVIEATDAGRNPSLLGTSLWSEKIIELQPTGLNTANIVWEWHVWDHLVQDFDSLKSNYGVINQHPELINLNFPSVAATSPDWLHINSIDYNAELDQILISSHNLSELWIVDHSTSTQEAASHSGGMYGKGGDLLYRWGNPSAYNRGSTNDKKLFGQHNAQWIRNGLKDAGNILLFNNGLQRPAGNFSSVEILEPPIDSTGNYLLLNNQSYQPDSTYWKYTAVVPTNFYSMNISGAQRLSNGNTLICEGASGNFFEIDSLKNTVWNYVNPVSQAGNILSQGAAAVQNSVFRCTQLDTSYPGLSGQSLVPGNPIELNPLSYVCTMLTAIPANENVSGLVHAFCNSSGQIFIRSDAAIKIQTALLSDLTGKIIDQWETLTIGRNEYFPLSMKYELSGGIYFLRFRTSEAEFSFKLIH
jgi:hypothetical protein